MKKFAFPIILIALLLGAIPFCISAGLILLAKLLGIITVIAVPVILRWWLKRAAAGRSFSGVIKFTANDKFFFREQIPGYTNLSSSSRKAIEERAGVLLAETSFDNLDHSEPSREHCLACAFLLARLFYTEVYQSLNGKIVVFGSQEKVAIREQQDKIILFIAPETINVLLHDLVSGKEHMLNHEEELILLRQFCRISDSSKK